MVALYVEAISTLGQGWVGEEALAMVVYCALKHRGDGGSYAVGLKALFVVTAVLLICAFALLPGGCGGKEEPNTGTGDGARETITGTLHSFILLHDLMERSYLVYVPGSCEAGTPTLISG